MPPTPDQGSNLVADGFEAIWEAVRVGGDGIWKEFLEGATRRSLEVLSGAYERRSGAWMMLIVQFTGDLLTAGGVKDPAEERLFVLKASKCPAQT